MPPDVRKGYASKLEAQPPDILKGLDGKAQLFRTSAGIARKKLLCVTSDLSILSKIFSLAVDAELIDTNPCRRVRKFRLNNGRMRVLSGADEKELFSALGDNELVKNIVTVALHTGLRRGEIFNLKWFDVDFTRGLIQVRESKSGKNGLFR